MPPLQIEISNLLEVRSFKHEGDAVPVRWETITELTAAIVQRLEFMENILRCTRVVVEKKRHSVTCRKVFDSLRCAGRSCLPTP